MLVVVIVGCLHAGFYYTADSLKARFTRIGNKLLTEYCDRKKIPIRKCGKLVVAKDASDLPQLDELIRRGQANQVQLEVLTADEAKEIEPRVKTFQKALFSPSTSSVDPIQVTLAMKEDAEDDGVEFRSGEAYLGRDGQKDSDELSRHIVQIILSIVRDIMRIKLRWTLAFLKNTEYYLSKVCIFIPRSMRRHFAPIFTLFPI